MSDRGRCRGVGWGAGWRGGPRRSCSGGFLLSSISWRSQARPPGRVSNSTSRPRRLPPGILSSRLLLAGRGRLVADHRAAPGVPGVLVPGRGGSGSRLGAAARLFNWMPELQRGCSQARRALLVLPLSGSGLSPRNIAVAPCRPGQPAGDLRSGAAGAPGPGRTFPYHAARARACSRTGRTGLGCGTARRFSARSLSALALCGQARLTLGGRRGGFHDDLRLWAACFCGVCLTPGTSARAVPAAARRSPGGGQAGWAGRLRWLPPIRFFCLCWPPALCCGGPRMAEAGLATSSAPGAGCRSRMARAQRAAAASEASAHRGPGQCDGGAACRHRRSSAPGVARRIKNAGTSSSAYASSSSCISAGASPARAGLTRSLTRL